MEYRDFDLRLAPRGDGHYTATVTKSPHGHGHTVFQIPPPLDGYRIPISNPEGRVSRELFAESQAFGHVAEPAGLDPDQAGRLLFETVLNGKVGDLFKQCHDPAYGLRINLILQEGDDQNTTRLHALPWELLCYQQHLAINPRYSIVRRLDGSSPVEHVPAPLHPPFKPRVLLVGANPNDTDPLNLAREKRMLTELAESSLIEIEPLKDISQRDVRRRHGFQIECSRTEGR